MNPYNAKTLAALVCATPMLTAQLQAVHKEIEALIADGKDEEYRWRRFCPVIETYMETATQPAPVFVRRAAAKIIAAKFHTGELR